MFKKKKVNEASAPLSVTDRQRMEAGRARRAARAQWRKRIRGGVTKKLCIVQVIILALFAILTYDVYLRKTGHANRSPVTALCNFLPFIDTDAILISEYDPVIKEREIQEAKEKAKKEEEAALKAAEEAVELERLAAIPLKDSPLPVTVGDQEFTGGFHAYTGERTVSLTSEVDCSNLILIDLSTDDILAEKGCNDRIYPASMTKIMTLLVACEEISDFNHSYIMQQDASDYCYFNGLFAAGFTPSEVVPIKDILYGAILPSGGDAACAIALYLCGSEEEFVKLMNAKVEELGLSETTHFSNCAGIFSEENYSTPYDMAMILKAAIENDMARTVLSARTYTTTATTEHPIGITFENSFLTSSAKVNTSGTVVGAKTGFVNESGFCAASYYLSNTFHPYICVTTNGTSSSNCINDHAAIYGGYAP